MKVSCTRFAVLLLAGLFQSCTAQSQYTFIVFNDIKGQLEEYNRGSEAEKPFSCSGQTCRGGLRKIVQQIEVLRNSSLNQLSTFVLSPGNLVGGESGWLPILGWRTYGELMKYHYKPNAMSLGMNDFGAGLNRTLDYINASETPVVLHNLDCNDCGIFCGPNEKNFCSHPLIFRQGVYHLTVELGLVGFINPDVMHLSSPGELKFKEVIPALQSVIASSSNQYENYIAIGDGSLELARDILAQIPQIRLVIYGQGFGSSKNMIGNFPEVSGNGFIATGGNYGSTVGKILAEIGPTGLAVDTLGSELHFTDLVASPGNASSMYTRFQMDVMSVTKTVASSQLELVGGEVCWREECNLGNLVTDAMVHCVLGRNVSLPSGEPIFALWHSGAFFMDSIRANSDITTLDILKWLPYHNRVYFVRIKGSNLLEVFNKSATGITAHLNGTEKDWGQFLQVSSGMQIFYSTTSGNPQVVRIKLLHGIVMDELDPLRIYYFAIPSFIYEGRNLYGFAKSYWDLLSAIDFDDSCVTEYAEAMKRLAVGVMDRILIDTLDYNYTTSTAPEPVTQLPVTSLEPVSTPKPKPNTGSSVTATASSSLTVAAAVITFFGVRKIF